MKNLILPMLALMLTISGFSQNEPSKNLPPVEMLPKKGEVRSIYELSAEADYKIFDISGRLIQSGNAQFIDYTHYKKGVYFIHSNGKTLRLEV